MMRPTRRRVLALGAAGLLAGGVGWQFRPTRPVDVRRGVFTPPSGRADAPRLLVAYATMTGSSGEQAELIARAGADAGFRVTLAPVEDAPDPAAHDAALLGGPVRAGTWLDEALVFAARNADALSSRPVALFQCSMTAAGLRLGGGGALSEEDRARLSRDMGALFEAAPALAAAPRAFFSGAVRFDYLRPPVRVMYPVVSGSLLFGDRRDPREVAQFADALFAGPAFGALLA